MKSCNSCGKCCVKYSNGQLSASEQDIALWQSFRPDIAEYVLDQKIWFEPSEKTLLELCPWLRKAPDSERFHCDIYLDRPEDCRAYPTTIHEMINDQCEMLEPSDLQDIRRAQRELSVIRSHDI